MMSSLLCCMAFGILVFFPKSDGQSLTWEQPLPVQTVPSHNPVDHFSSRKLEGIINATLIWNFLLNQLNFVKLVIWLNGTPIAGVGSSGPEPQPGFENQFAIDWIANENLVKLFVFNVPLMENGTFTCEVTADEVKGYNEFQFRSHLQLYVVDPTSNIVVSTDQNVVAPAELTLNCSADGIPKPRITWTRLSDNSVVTMPLNIIRGIKTEETYRCTADNGVGNALTKDVIVNILFSPKVKLAKKVFVGQGNTASLTCQVEGNPKPTISWSPCDPPHFVCDKQYFNVSKVQTARTNFNCTATNSLGTDSATTVLTIGGYNISLRICILEECDETSSVWEALKKVLTIVFERNLQNYSGAELIDASCESLIFDLVVKFSNEVAEDDIIAIIQNASVNGKLGGLNVNTSCMIRILPDPKTTTVYKIVKFIGAGLGIAAFVGSLIYFCRMKCRRKTKKVSSDDSGREGKSKSQYGGDGAGSTSLTLNSIDQWTNPIKAEDRHSHECPA
ncbi:PREDICTED: limbic system-associated membrane protein-like [Acropora digitifera]|uniref:limbic system-associated membrane protein-like n=1 Tax=Acropora digitifera TaxID=70779 RepID=UPI00077A03C3|nr:PREDICTED: limbic system-associated membrane protein-like [Acropora digitifera]